jgi:hypothetical protein
LPIGALPTGGVGNHLLRRFVGLVNETECGSEEIAAKNRAYVEAARNTTDMISSHTEAVRAAMKAVAHEGAPTSAHHAAMIDMRQAG